MNLNVGLLGELIAVEQTLAGCDGGRSCVHQMNHRDGNDFIVITLPTLHCPGSATVLTMASRQRPVRVNPRWGRYLFS